MREYCFKALRLGLVFQNLIGTGALYTRACYQPEVLAGAVSSVTASVAVQVILTRGRHPLQAGAARVVLHDVQRYLVLLPRGQARLPVRGLRPPQALGDLFLVFFILKAGSTLVRPGEGPRSPLGSSTRFMLLHSSHSFAHSLSA